MTPTRRWIVIKGTDVKVLFDWHSVVEHHERRYRIMGPYFLCSDVEQP